MQPNSQQSTAQSLESDSDENKNRHIIFSLAEELYATELMQVKEVIKVGQMKPVPFVVPHFKGIFNLRGQIVSVVDLRIKFNLPKAAHEGLILIVDTKAGVIGVIIDDVVSVKDIPPTNIDSQTRLESKVPLSFFKGIAKCDDRLVSVIDIAGCLSSEDLKAIRDHRAA